jgi:hypothetical protein
MEWKPEAVPELDVARRWSERWRVESGRRRDDEGAPEQAGSSCGEAVADRSIGVDGVLH